MEKISVVLPCYNHGKYVEDAIKSVLEQTYTNFELFVFDNGSTDNSWEVIQKFEDPRITKIKFEENNLLKVKQEFIKMASGEYFAIMHSDDLWKKEKLEKQMIFLREHKNAKVCFTWSEFVDEHLHPIEEWNGFFEEYNKTEKEWWNIFLSRANHLSCPSSLCKRDIYIKYFGKLYPYRQIADFYCWMKILQETNIYIVEEILVNQRIHYYGNNQNESSRTYENISRESVELQYIYYDIIDNMEDKLFVKCFCDEMDGGFHHLDVMCKKFLFFVTRGKKIYYEYDNAIRYYNTYFDYEENGNVFYQYLQDKYGFSRNDFFEYEGKDRYDFYKLYSRIARWKKLENTDFSTIKYPDSISIYGCGQIGKVFCKKIKPYCHIEQLIDAKPKITSFEGIPVVTLDKAEIDKDSVIVVIPTYDMTQIIQHIKKECGEIADNHIISFEDFIKMGKVIDDKF